MASLIRSVGGLSKCFYQGLWLADLNADVIGQSMNRRGVAQEFPYHVTGSVSFSARYGLPEVIPTKMALYEVAHQFLVPTMLRCEE